MKKIVLYNLLLCLNMYYTFPSVIDYDKNVLQEDHHIKIKLSFSIKFIKIILTTYVLHTTCKSLYKVSHWIFQKNKPLQGYKSTEEVFLPVNAFTQAFYTDYPEYAQDLITSTQNFLNKEHSVNVPREVIVRGLAKFYNLYKYPTFINGLIDEPEFEKHLIDVNKRLKYNKKFYNTLANIPGYKKEELCELIKKLLEIIQYRKKQEACRQEKYKLPENDWIKQEAIS